MKNEKIKIAITGDMGSGKSFICEEFKKIGIPIYNSDLETKRITEKVEVRKKINDHFIKKHEIYLFRDDKFNIDLAKFILFNNEKLLNEFTNIVHPYVHKDYIEWHEKQNSKYTILESAIIYETGFFKQFDGIIFVSTSKKKRLERIVNRDISKEDYDKRMSKQIDPDIKKRASNFVIENEGDNNIQVEVALVNSKIIHSLNFKQNLINHSN